MTRYSRCCSFCPFEAMSEQSYYRHKAVCPERPGRQKDAK